MLANWVKSEEPFLPYPPPDMELVGWRDPFIFEFMTKGGQHKEWGMLMGSGIKGKGGAVMIYRSDNLRSGQLATDEVAVSPDASLLVGLSIWYNCPHVEIRVGVVLLTWR